MNLARVELTEHGRALVVTVEGEIDLSNADQIRDDVSRAVPRDAVGVALDLTGTTYIDSSGIRFLFDLAQRLHARRQQLVLVVNDQALVRRVIVLTKLDDAVPLHERLDDALAALDGA
jgi:anti-anti-sigma factor